MFTIDKIQFGWNEIAAAAQCWGEWDGLQEEARRGIACAKRAAHIGESPAPDELQAAMTGFRYAHNLISGQETQSWIAWHGLALAEWQNYFRRALLKDRWAGRAAELLSQHPVGAEEVAAILKCEAVCSGRFSAWAVRLAGRAALAAKQGELPRVCSTGELIAEIERRFEQTRQITVTPQKLQTKITDHLLDWVRFDCRYVWFAEERIAREARLCVAEDGLSLDEVARDARGVVQPWTFYLDEIEAGARPRFLAARTGDCLGPIKMMEGFPVFAINQKQMPSSADPHIRRRAEAALLGQLVEQQVNERVVWMK